MMGIKRHPAFVLGLEENGYGIVRSLAREGIPVVGIYSKRESFGRFSRYCKHYYLDPSIQNEEQISEILIALRRQFDDKPVLFPTSDKYALFLSKQRENLSDHFLYHWVSCEYFSRIIHKSEMSQICEQAGVLAPKTYVTRPEENVAQRCKDFLFPCIIKPVRSFDTRFPVGMKNFVAYLPKDLLDFYDHHPRLKGETIWQEIIEGGDDDIFQGTVLIRQSGEVGTVFGVRKLRQYPGFGRMSFGRSEWNDVVAAETTKFLQFLGHRGFASLEFKFQPKDGRFYFVEMNPRLPMYNILFADAGVNLPYLGYMDLTRGSEVLGSKTKQRDGVYWIDLDTDLGWLYSTWKKGPISFWKWAGSLVKARSYVWFDWKDPGPFMAAGFQLFRTGVRKLITNSMA